MGRHEPGQTSRSARLEVASRTDVRRSEPMTGATFRIEIEGLPGIAAVEVLFPEGRIVADRGKRVVRYGSLTLRRAVTDSNDWYAWWDRARRPRARARTSRTVRVRLLDRFQADVTSWTFDGAEPTAYSLSPLNALTSTPLIETLELSVGGFEAAFAAPSGRA